MKYLEVYLLVAAAVLLVFSTVSYLFGRCQKTSERDHENPGGGASVQDPVDSAPAGTAVQGTFHWPTENDNTNCLLPVVSNSPVPSGHTQDSGFPYFQEAHYPPHWTGAPVETEGVGEETVLLPGRFGMGGRALCHFIQNWLVLDTFFSRFPGGPWPQFVGLPGELVREALQNHLLTVRLREETVCLVSDTEDGCAVHRLCHVLFTDPESGRVSRTVELAN